MKNLKYLIFTVTAGSGHNSAAKTISNKILKENPFAEVKTIDVYKSYSTKLGAWAMDNKGYFCLPLYNFIYKKLEKAPFKNAHKSPAQKITFKIMQGILKEIKSFKPDVIISTHFCSTIALTNLKKIYNIPAEIFSQILDYGPSPFWECCTGVDKLFVADESLIDWFKFKGFNEKQLLVSGIPIKSDFNKVYDKSKVREKLNLDELFTVIIMKSGFFPISDKKIVKQLKKIKQKIQVIIINGKSLKSWKYFEKTKNLLNHKILNFMFVDNVYEYYKASDLYIGKAGGLSTTEAVASKLPMLILDKLPMQETYNKNFMIEKGFALSPNTTNNIADEINKILTSGEELKSILLKLNCEKSNVALDIIWQNIRKAKPKNYDNFFIENDKTVLKKVKEKLRSKDFKAN